jgi:hypothetical protein
MTCPYGVFGNHNVHARLVMSRYIRFVRFSFLILIGRSATLEGMKIKSVTPMHHLTIMVSSVSPAWEGSAS